MDFVFFERFLLKPRRHEGHEENNFLKLRVLRAFVVNLLKTHFTPNLGGINTLEKGQGLANLQRQLRLGH